MWYHASLLRIIFEQHLKSYTNPMNLLAVCMQLIAGKPIACVAPLPGLLQDLFWMVLNKTLVPNWLPTGSFGIAMSGALLTVHMFSWESHMAL
jgi:hypothetical protein